LVEAHQGRQLKLYVYNLETDKCRDVVIIPDPSWGGEGSLGCGIGYGYLHRIPHNETPQEAGQETQEVVDTRKKTISSALGISAEEGKEPQTTPNPSAAPSNPFANPVGPPSSNAPSTTCADHINGAHSHSPVNVEIPGMPSPPHQQTITTPLSIPGMPPITVSAPAMMSGTPFSGALPTAAPPPTPNDPSWFANAQSQGHQFGPPPPAGGYYQPQAQPQFTAQMFGAFNQPPPSTGYSPNSVPLFNPVANSTPNANDNTAPNSNFIRIFDPTAPPTNP